MFGRHIRKKAPHDWAQTCRDALDEAGALRQAHYAKPKRHHSDQTKSDRYRGFRALKRAGGDLIQSIVPAANRDRQNNEGEPDVVQHNGVSYYRGAIRGERLYACFSTVAACRNADSVFPPSMRAI